MVAEERTPAGEDAQLEVAQSRAGARHDPRVERTRHCVLAAARDLLAEGGLEAVTVNAIADRSGVNKTTVYRNWPDPHGLVLEALTSIQDPPMLPDTGSVRGDLVEMFTGLAASLQRPPWDRLLPSVIGAAARDEATRAYHGALTRSRRDHARTVVERAIARGELPPGSRPDDVIEAIVGPLYYRVLLTKERVSRADAEALVDRALTWSRAT